MRLLRRPSTFDVGVRALRQEKSRPALPHLPLQRRMPPLAFSAAIEDARDDGFGIDGEQVKRRRR
jgi:hypothetical protein